MNAHSVLYVRLSVCPSLCVCLHNEFLSFVWWFSTSSFGLLLQFAVPHIYLIFFLLFSFFCLFFFLLFLLFLLYSLFFKVFIYFYHFVWIFLCYFSSTETKYNNNSLLQFQSRVDSWSWQPCNINDSMWLELYLKS